ncbi:MAG: hypothetical protein OXU54_05150 [Gammaproteobacteria bacterium]|nr:hypothetical protein [Gammaproteobacteria bacterium]
MIIRLFELCVVAVFGVLVGLVIKESQLSAALRPDEYLNVLQRVVCTPDKIEIEREVGSCPLPLASDSISPADSLLNPSHEEENELIPPADSFEEKETPQTYFFMDDGPLSEEPSPLSLPEPLPPPDDELEEPPDRDESGRIERLLEFLRS